MQSDQIGYVYFARAENGLVKIGFTADIKRRLQNLQTNGGAPIVEVMHVTIYAPAYLERYMHRTFESRKVRGEWYLFDENDWAWVQNWINQYADTCARLNKFGNGRFYDNPALVCWAETAWWQPRDLAELQVQSKSETLQ